MPATDTTSCSRPAAGSSTVRRSTARPLPPPLASSHDAVLLLKYSDDSSRRTACCFARAMAREPKRDEDEMTAREKTEKLGRESRLHPEPRPGGREVVRR